MLQAITSAYHVTLKFPTPVRVGVVGGNQIEACRCYALALKWQLHVHQEANTIGSASSADQPSMMQVSPSKPT